MTAAEDLATGRAHVDLLKQHLARLDVKRERLRAATVEAEIQYLTEVRREFDAGRMTWTQLHEIYLGLQECRVAGLVDRWTTAIGAHPRRVSEEVRRERGLVAGLWRGHSPLHPGDVHPPHGQSVVYVLFDAANRPVYVGSTSRLAIRFSQHRRGGKAWHSWEAHPCATRAEAFEVEQQFLRQYMPDLNRQGARR